MRSAELDREMPDVIPIGCSPDSAFLFERMTERTLAAALTRPGARILDVASGFGQDSAAMAAAGARCIGVEPSLRMSRWAREQHAAAQELRWVRGWGDALPFADASFDAVVCKGALDHFDAPETALSEMARVTRDDGHVVLAVANFSSLACRAGAFFDRLAARWLKQRPRGRRAYDVPADHFTRYDLALLREQAEPHLGALDILGVSLLWGLPVFSRWLERLPQRHVRAALEVGDGIARQCPALSDVVIVLGRPGSVRSTHARRPISPDSTAR